VCLLFREQKEKRECKESRESPVAGDYPGQWEIVGQLARREILEIEGEGDSLAIL